MIASLVATLLAFDSHGNYVIAAYVLVFAIVATYAVWLVRRGRTLSKQVKPEDRRWMKS